MKEKTYKISEVAEILGVHPDTVRNWEDEGLIIPDRIGTRGDRRYTVLHIQEIKDKNLISTLAKKNPKKKDYSNLSKEELIKEIQILNKQKTFGLVYEDKIEQIVEDCKNKAPILKPREKFRIEDKKGDQKNPKHILIQGDNYHALKVLNYTHKNKIDVIYIDPPYNTGNKDFIYNDDFVDKEDSYRHSKWISFMEKRLVLARELLKDSGVIFISIDDNEQARLKLLCDEIFGEENFITNISRLMKSGGNKGKYFSPNIEYVLVYAKNIFFLPEFRLKLKEEYKDKIYSKIENGERYREMGLYQAGLDIRPNQRYWIKCPDGSFVIPPGASFPKVKEGEKIKPNTKDGVWRWIFSTYLDELNKGNIVFKKTNSSSLLNELGGKSNWNIYTKIWLSDRIEDGRVPTNYIGEFENRHSSQELKNLDIDFQFAKPKDLILYLISLTNKKNDLYVLDFFAGSGTTGHAVLDLNKQDDGNRQVILCTNNENGIAEKVTFERMKRVMKGYKNKKGENVEGLGGELEYFETELVDVENMDRVSDKKKLAFTLEAGWVIATKENTFNEIEKNDSYQIFEGIENIKGKNVSKTVAIYFKENLDKLKELENKILKKENVKLYIFSHYTNEFASEYAEHKNIKVCDIPEPILKVYKGFNNN